MSHACIDSFWPLPVTGSSIVLEFLVLRFANIFHLTDFSVDTIRKAVKKVKFNESLSTDCNSVSDSGIYNNFARERIVKSVEKELKINSSDLSFENMTSEDLKTAAEFFIYLNACPHTNSLKSLFILWADFYADLFGKQSPDHIVLTLNRIVHQENGKIDRVRNMKLLKRASNLFSLKSVLSLMPGIEKSATYLEDVNPEKLDRNGNKYYFLAAKAALLCSHFISYIL